MRTLLLPFLLVLASCQTTSLSVNSPTYERAVSQFETAAFGSDFGTATGFLLRWDQPARFRLVAPNGIEIGQVEADTIAEVNEQMSSALGRLSARHAGSQQATLTVAFLPRDQFPGLFRAYARTWPAEVRERVIHEAQASLCYGLIGQRDPSSRPGVILTGFVLINSDLDEAGRRACLHQEMFQVAGLPTDACHYRPSVICEPDFPQTVTEIDLILLRTLYDPRLKPGMTREEAMPIARKIIRELWRD